MSRRPRHLARTVIALLLAIAVWTGLASLALRLVQGPRVQVWAAKEISAQLTRTIGEPVRIGSVRFLPFPPRVVLHDVALGPPGSPHAEIDTCEVAFGEARLAEREVVLSQVTARGIRVRASLPGAKGGTSRPWVHVVVRQLELSDVQIDRLDLPANIVLSARNVDARVSGTTRRAMGAAVVHAGSFTLTVPGLRPISGGLAAWGEGTPDGFRVERLRAQGSGWSVDGRCEVSLATGRFAGSGVTAVRLEEVDRTLDLGIGLAGAVQATLDLEVDKGKFSLDGKLSSPQVDVVGFRIDELAGEAHLTHDGLEATLTRGIFAGGEIDGSYKLTGLREPWSHRVAVRGNGVEVAAFLHELRVDDAGLSGAARVSADLTWDGRQIKEGVGTAVVDLTAGGGDVPISGRVVLSLEQDGMLHIEAPGAVLAGAPLRWEGQLTLGTWLPTWSLQGDHVKVETVARLLRGWVGTDVIPASLHGESAVDLRLHGPFNDLTVVGDVAVAPIAFGPIDADGLEASFQVGQGVLSVDNGKVLVGPGRALFRGTLKYGEGGALSLDVAGRGVPVVRAVAWGGVHAPVSGMVDFDGRVGGTLGDPTADARLTFHEVTVAGVPFGRGAGSVHLAKGVVRVEDFAVGAFAASLLVDFPHQEATVDATLKGFGLEGISPPLARLVGGALDCTLQGSFPFASPSGRLEVASPSGLSGTVQLDAGGVQVRLARPEVWRLEGAMDQTASGYQGRFTYAVTSLRRFGHDLMGADLSLDGALAGHADVAVSSGSPPSVDGVIETLSIDVEGERASLEGPMIFTTSGGAVEIPGATLVGPRSRLFVRGGRQADGTLHGNVAGQLPAALLGLVWRGTSPSGTVELLGEISGTDSAPRFEGGARVRNGAMRLPGLPEPVTEISGYVELVPEAIRLDSLNFRLGSGTGTCSGRIFLAPRVELDLTIAANNVRWPLAMGFRPSLSGSLRLTGPLDDLSLSGQTTLERGAFSEDLNIQGLVVQQILTPRRVVATESAPISFNIVVRVPGTLEINTALARLTADGELRLVGTSAQPGLLGRLEAAPGGEFTLAGVRYNLDRGTVTFTSYDRIDPLFDVLARTTLDSYEISVSLVGTLDHMTTSLTSNPALPEMDIVSLLTTGRRADQATSAQAGSFASTFLTEQLTGLVTRRARTLLDVDQFRIDPSAVTSTGGAATRLTVVKRLSPTWTVAVATNLDSNREEIVSSTWRLAPGVYLEGRREADGRYSMEVRWQRRY
ncbi:MAG: translocation/assembly module TamB domain-containing protein [Acidobacteriota bacterium]